MKEFGVLYGNINESYSNLGATIARLSYNLIGVYYPVSGQVNVILFRAFDGSRITYFGNYLSLEQLTRSHLIKELMIYPFNEDAWKLDGKEESLVDRFHQTIKEVLLLSDFRQDYRNMLLYFAGLSLKPPVTGYHIINNIITSSTTKFGTFNPPNTLQRTIVESRYFSDSLILCSEEKRTVHDDRTYLEVDGLLKQLMDTFCELIISNEEYEKHIGTLISGQLNFLPLSISLPTQSKKELRLESVISNVDDEFIYLKNVIEDIMRGFDSPYIPVINVPEIVENYNKLADKLKQPTIDPNSINKQHISIGILAKSSPVGFHKEEISVKLKCGQIEVIPTKQDIFDGFTDDQLIQFHRYIGSCQTSDGRFNYMNEKIIRELATRAQS